MTLLSEEAGVRAWLAREVGCDARAIGRLEALLTLLAAENARQNLVSAASLDEAWVRHVADSAQLLTVSRETRGPWLDLGSGAGFPGLVIAVCRPELEVRLIESRTKRCGWLGAAVQSLGLKHCQIDCRKLEAVPSFAAGTISARAFAPLDRLIALSERFSTRETLWLLPKGKNGQKELAEMPQLIRRLFHVEPSLTESGSVVLVGEGAPR